MPFVECYRNRTGSRVRLHREERSAQGFPLHPRNQASMLCGGIAGMGNPYRKWAVTRNENHAMRGFLMRHRLTLQKPWMEQARSAAFRLGNHAGRSRIARTMDCR